MEATLYRRIEEGLIECGVCQHRCRIQAGKTGFCRQRKSDGNVLWLNDSLSSACIDPIEKKPLYHFHPGSRVLSLGGIGCNFRCRHCQNWSISQSDHQTGQWLSPAEAVRIAAEEGCGGIAWTYNEPTMWFEYALEGMRLAKEAGLYTVFVTNGFMTLEALDLMAPYLDAFRVDLKGFSDRAYAELCRIQGWKGILDVAMRAKQRGM
ncbi:MAG: radical SAM protein, partial [Bacteroidota bacterium]